jgi:putative tryptophan/tyrosine transport system substrate-binding protein
MKRRDALTAMAIAALLPMYGFAQQQNLPIIGLLVTHAPFTDVVFNSMRSGLKKYGYIDGNNIKIEARTALGQLERVPGIAEELVRLRPLAIMVVNDIAIRAVKAATNTIPIVMVGYAVRDPVASKLIESYSRPGGNITGVYSVDSALLPKRLELLKQAIPGLSRVAAFWDPNFGRYQIDELLNAAKLLNLELAPFEIRNVDDIEPAFKAAKRAQTQALISTYAPVLWIHRTRLAQLALDAKLPSISEYPEHAEAGGFISYGSSGVDTWANAAYYVDRLMKGVKISDLPVEQVSTFKLVVNQKTAKALGIKLPDSILYRADEVIK